MTLDVCEQAVILYSTTTFSSAPTSHQFTHIKISWMLSLQRLHASYCAFSCILDFIPALLFHIKFETPSTLSVFTRQFLKNIFPCFHPILECQIPSALKFLSLLTLLLASGGYRQQGASPGRHDTWRFTLDPSSLPAAALQTS